MTAPADLRAEFLERISGFVTAAFALVAALAWNEAIQSIFGLLFPGERGELAAKLVYATAVTVLAVLAVVSLGRAAAKAKAHLAGRPAPRTGP